MKKRIRVWDLPIRVFHWLLVLCIVGSLLILTLLIFRIVWGFVGSKHARFTAFMPTRPAIIEYLQGRSPRYLGHNPIGALSVFALLLVLSVQVATGLFVDDEIAFQGPFAKYVSSSIVSILSEIHEGNQVLIYTLITIHIAAIWFYKKFKGENLIKPMLVGDKEIDPSEEAQYQSSDLGQPSKDGVLERALALFLFCLIAIVVR